MQRPPILRHNLNIAGRRLERVLEIPARGRSAGVQRLMQLRLADYTAALVRYRDSMEKLVPARPGRRLTLKPATR